MRIATWNVNSIRVRELHVADWLREHQPDVLCLQETKVEDDDFPTDELQRLGYGVAMAGQRSYNGVAILSRRPMKDISIGLQGDTARAEKRLIAATIDGLRILSAYVPNGKSVESPNFRLKLDWLERLRATLAARADSNVVLVGDFNIARDDRDVYDPEAFRGKLHFHPDEHAALDRILDLGLVDAFRLHESAGGHYSWWDYRGTSLRRNNGLRIDYIFLSQPLTERCAGCTIHKDERHRERPSDHVPVVVDLEEDEGH